MSGVEANGHRFPVIWVERPLASGGHDRVPWPADAVWPASKEPVTTIYTPTAEQQAAVIDAYRAAPRLAAGAVGTTAHVISFGYLHGDPPPADITVDVRRLLRDPHVDPALRELTGADPQVWNKVLTTPGADQFALDIAFTTAELLKLGDVTVAFGCAGGRHRSYVLAERVAEHLRALDWQVQVEHRDVHRPVVQREVVTS